MSKIDEWIKEHEEKICGQFNSDCSVCMENAPYDFCCRIECKFSEICRNCHWYDTHLLNIKEDI